jgi:GT2 family glycosyltransferase
MNQADILIIGVIYNTYPETIRYIDSLAPLATGRITLILVDNSDKAIPKDFLKKIKSYPFLHYLKTGGNSGYFGGAREGLNYYLQKFATYPPWILVTNVDIVFTPQFFHSLNKLNDQKNLGVVAPSIISQIWKTDYNPKIPLRYSKRKLKFYRLLYSNFLLHNLFLLGAYSKKRLLGLLKGNQEEFEDPQHKGKKIYAPHGSCLVFKDTYFNRGGTLDLPNFLFGEEVLVAETALQLGLDVEYHPELVIHDYEHASVGFWVTPTINTYYRESILSILERFYP